MVNPLLTILFDLVLVGGATAILAAMVAEYLACREPHVGSARVRPTQRPVARPRRITGRVAANAPSRRAA